MLTKVMFSITLLVALAGCGAVEDSIYYEDAPDQALEADYENQMDNEVEIREDMIDDAVGHALLNDLEYMLYVMENNFALFDVAYWARGVDINRIIENIRAEVLTNPDMDLDEFYHLLRWHFSPLAAMPTGHFNIVSILRHHYITTNNPSHPVNALLLNNPQVQAFYVPRHPEGEPTNFRPLRHSAAELAKMTDEAAELFIGLVEMYGEIELAENIATARRNGDFEEANRLIDLAIDFIESTPNIVTEIIEEGRVAYLSINSFMTYLPPFQHEERQILDFYSEILDFEHLIIDLRRNRGGYTTYFPQIVMGPLIDTTMQAEGFAFMRRGSYTAGFALTPASLPVSGAEPLDSELRSVSEILSQHDIPQLN